MNPTTRRILFALLATGLVLFVLLVFPRPAIDFTIGGFHAQLNVTATPAATPSVLSTDPNVAKAQKVAQANQAVIDSQKALDSVKAHEGVTGMALKQAQDNDAAAKKKTFEAEENLRQALIDLCVVNGTEAKNCEKQYPAPAATSAPTPTVQKP